MGDAKPERLKAVLEDATGKVNGWPDWKRSEEIKRDLEKLAELRNATAKTRSSRGESR
jgi:hypothetical protein